MIVSDINKYIGLDIRICRPVMLSAKSKKTVMNHMEKMLQLQPKYDVANIEKLLFKYWYSKFRPDISKKRFQLEQEEEDLNQEIV